MYTDSLSIDYLSQHGSETLATNHRLSPPTTTAVKIYFITNGDEWRTSITSPNSSSRFPSPQGVKLSYGTTGSRTDASIIDFTMFKVGILDALRSLQTRYVIVLMITTSHNIIFDNGVKIADHSGGMLLRCGNLSLILSLMLPILLVLFRKIESRNKLV